MGEPLHRYTRWGYGDPATFPEHAKYELERRERDAWLEETATEIVEQQLANCDLSSLIDEHEEHTLLDLLLDAHRYGGDTKAAFADLMDGLRQSMQTKVIANLKAECKRLPGDRP